MSSFGGTMLPIADSLNEALRLLGLSVGLLYAQAMGSSSPLYHSVAALGLMLSFLGPQTVARPGAMPLQRPIASALKPYTNCKLPGGPELVQTMSLPHVPFTRAAQTLIGPKKITIADGVLSAYAFRPGVPYANVKIEQLPAATYSTQKPELISEFDAINAKGEDTHRNYALKPTLNGFEIYGFDRTALDGNVLGIYLFFEDAHHVATTAYFLNAPAGQRQFQSINDYTALRETFLNAYTHCVRKSLDGAGNPSSRPTPRSTTPAPKRR